MIKKHDLNYLIILWLIWYLADYYRDLFKLSPGDNPAKISDQLLEHDDHRIVRVYFKKAKKTSDKSMKEIKEISNTFLHNFLLPRQKLLKPFIDGDEFHDIAEALYVIDVFENPDEIAFDVLYIDNHQAYQLMRYDQSMELQEYI